MTTAPRRSNRGRPARGGWPLLLSARKRRCLTQMAAAAALKVSIDTYQQWEYGHRPPHPRHYPALADFCYSMPSPELMAVQVAKKFSPVLP